MGDAVTTASAAVALGLVAAVFAGCGGGGGGAADKAGGSGAPLVLRLADSNAADQPDAPSLRYFAAQVAELSGGALRVHVVFEAAGNAAPDVEARTARMVLDGRFDLGWIGSRAWDELGVESFQALQAPLLVTDGTLLDRILTGPLAGEMLSALASRRVVGIALVPDLLRHPAGIGHPLVSLTDFAGARVRIQPSRATAALIAALGAVPVEVGNAAVVHAMAQHRLDGWETAIGTAPSGSVVTGNVTLFGKALTLIASRRAYERLSDEQRSVLARAAERTIRHAVATRPPESSLARTLCANGGSIAMASPSELAALTRAVQPVYAELERDPRTRAFIAEIRRLKASTPRDPALVVPAGCRRSRQAAVAAPGTRPPAGIVDGTYHLVFTRADALAFGPPASNPENDHFPVVETRTLEDGKWLYGGGLRGTYTISGSRITFVTPEYGSVETFVFSLDHDGTLHLRPVLPMDRGDQWVVAGEPWHRVGRPRHIG